MTTTPPLPLSRAHCLNHPRREAAARCTSCGQPFCRECVTELDGRMVCGPCYQAKTQAPVAKKRDWFLLSVALQALIGLALIWWNARMLGERLMQPTSSFHEGHVWEQLLSK